MNITNPSTILKKIEQPQRPKKSSKMKYKASESLKVILLQEEFDGKGNGTSRVLKPNINTKIAYIAAEISKIICLLKNGTT